MLFSHLLHVSTCSIITSVTWSASSLPAPTHCKASVSHPATTSAIILPQHKEKAMMVSVLHGIQTMFYHLLSPVAERYMLLYSAHCREHCRFYWALEHRGGYMYDSTWGQWLPAGPWRNIRRSLGVINGIFFNEMFCSNFSKWQHCPNPGVKILLTPHFVPKCIISCQQGCYTCLNHLVLICCRPSASLKGIQGPAPHTFYQIKYVLIWKLFLRWIMT